MRLPSILVIAVLSWSATAFGQSSPVPLGPTGSAGGGGGSGAVTSVSVTTANGVSGTVASPTTTPAITLILGAITPTSVNGNTFTTGTYTLTGAAGKTLTFNNTLTLSGTDGSTLNIGAGGTLGSNAYTSTAYCALAGAGACNLTGYAIFPAGSSSQAAAQFGSNAATGIYSRSANFLDIVTNTIVVADFNGGNTIFGGPIAVSSSTSALSGTTALFISAGANVFQHGGADVAGPAAQTVQFQSVVAGTSNASGANDTIRGSLSTGSGTSGDVIFQTGGTGAAATVQNTAVTALTIKGATQTVLIASGKSLQLGNAFVSGAVTTTGYLTLQDSTGTVYKINACTGC